MTTTAGSVVSATTPNGPLIDKDGKATFALLKWMQSVGSTLNSGFDPQGNYQGPIGARATINGRATLASIVQFIDTGGIVEGPGIDFARAYLNKDTDHIADGTGFPLAGGKVAYAALVGSVPVAGKTLEFDGTHWLPVAIAVASPSAAHEWLNSYDAATGVFTKSQPDFSDISGQIATTQLPASGITSVEITARLTVGGTQGSNTYTNGLLTGQVQAT